MSRCTDTTQSLTPGGCFASRPTPFKQAGVANPFLAYQEILVLAVIMQTLDSPVLQPVGPVGRRQGGREGGGRVPLERVRQHQAVGWTS